MPESENRNEEPRLDENERGEDSGGELLGVLGITRSIVHILGAIVGLVFILFLLLAGGYLYALLGSEREGYVRSEAASHIQTLMLSLWDKIIPIASGILSIVAPVVIISLAIIAVRALSKGRSGPLNLAGIVTDLPSLVAVLIVVAICLLPLAGLRVPEVLNNIALVVVGFYFGRHQGPDTNSAGRGGVEVE